VGEEGTGLISETPEAGPGVSIHKGNISHLICRPMLQTAASQLESPEPVGKTGFASEDGVGQGREESSWFLKGS
jgi:hypothetical protein